MGFLKWDVSLLTRVVVLVVAVLLSLASAGISPARQKDICGPAQCKEGKKFHYRAGNVYAYEYVINATTSIESGLEEESGLHLSAQVAIKFSTACDAVLYMREVEVWQSHNGNGGQSDEHHLTPQDSQLSRALEEYPLRFSYADGLIEEICPNASESTFALNVKRGLLSTFQNTMRRLDLEHKGEEDDVHGRCKVEYALGTATSSSLTIRRSKDINSCGDKFGVFSSVQGTPYSFGTLHQSMPAVSSVSECQHVVDRNLLTELRCSETHRLQSLSRGKAGALTLISQSLKITALHDPENSTGIGMETEESLDISLSLPSSLQIAISEKSGLVFKRESLLFRHDYHLGRISNDFAAAKTALANFCASVKDGVVGEAGELLENLVYILRGLSMENMMKLGQEATNICQGDSALFDDALEAVGTAASVGVIKTRVLSGNASKETIESWIGSLTYIPKPDMPLLQEAIYLMKARKKYPQIILTLPSLAHAYCRVHSNCLTHRPISLLIQFFEGAIAQECGARSDEGAKTRRMTQIEVLHYLKGIGNFGVSAPGITALLGKCIHKNNSAEIRVAAIDAFRRMTCPSDVRILGSVFENGEEDAEVRIAAFIGLMRCPTYSTITWIKDLLEREEVNQVGSFVWTYLRNIQETALPSKAELQGLVADEKLSKKFASNAQKFSRNWEISTFYDDFNLGIGLDSNLIFSQNSYLPRSFALNLTVDLFGESINVFEATLRTENFEHYVESLFGPNGRFRNKDLHAIVSSFREKRAVPSKRRLKTLGLEYDAHRQYYSDPISSLSLRTFGSEVFFDRKVGAVPHEGLLKSFNPLNAFKRLTEKDTNWQKSRILLDSSYIIPTGAGLPLNLSAQASAVLRLKTTGIMMDAENFRANSELILRGEIEPSALVTVTGSMVLGTEDLRTGIKLRAHLRSSTAVETNVQIKGNSLVKMEFGLPKTKHQLLEYRSDVMFMQGNGFRVVGQVPELTPVCTGESIGRLSGVKLCRSSYFSLSPGSQVDDSIAPYFPLNGPAHFTLSLDKANPQLTATRFHYEWKENQEGTKLFATYEIKGSQNTKVLDLAFDLNRLNQDLLFQVMLTGNEFEVAGHLDPDLSNGRVNVSLTASNLFSLKTQIGYDTTENLNGKRVLVPTALVNLNGNKVLDSKGKVRIEEGDGALSFDGSLEVDLGSTARGVNVELRGSRNDTSLTLVWDAEYKTSATNTETIRWKSTISQFKHEEARQIDMTLNVDFSEFSDHNLGASWKYQGSEEGIEYSGEGRIGRGAVWQDRDALKIRHSATFHRNYDGSRCEWVLRISQPSRQTDWGLEGSLNTRGKSLDSAINLRYAPDKNLQTSLSLKRAPPGVLTFLQIGWNITASNQQPLQASLHFKETAHRVYQGKLGVDWFGRNGITVDMNFIERSRRASLDKELSLAIQSSTLQLVKLRAHVTRDPKEAKLRINTEYKGAESTWEVGHSQWNKGKGHKTYAELRSGGTVYSVTSEIETDNRFEWILKTDLSSKFPDLLLQIKLKDERGTNYFGLEYKWDATREPSKKFLVEYFMDLSTSDHQRSELLFMYPDRHFSFYVDHRRNDDDQSRVVMGRLSWDEEDHLHLNARLSPSSSSPDAYELKVDAFTPIQDLRNVSFTARLNCVKPHDCLINVDGTWGKGGRLSGVITSALESLEEEEDPEEDDEDDDEDDDEKGSRTSAHLRRTKLDNKPSSNPFPFSWRLQTNLTTSLPEYRDVRMSLFHSQWSPFSHKTDFDIQIPERSEINIASHWRIPRTLKEIWLTRAELHLKSTFEKPKIPNFQLRAIVGQQDDTDTLAWAGIYSDELQYVFKITGTPRFEEDGSLGFEITTSHPNYDKIFGSLNYAIGDESRLACQLGWPHVVISLETGYEWTGSWEEFQVFYTFTSPWEPLKNVNALAKIDSTQFEIKAEVNSVGVATKCEWLIDSFESFDIRFDASTPIDEFKKVGLIAKNSFDDDVTYHSQFTFAVNENQIGYKLEGGVSTEEDRTGESKVIQSQLELDTLLYPTIRSSFTLRQRDSKFNLGLSLLLREGPINISGELHLLDLFRFNEKITITTPFPGLFELEINLTPAFITESELYNFGVHTRWRSNSEWKEGGLFIRCGDQSVLATALEADLAAAETFESGDDDEEDSDEDEDDEEVEAETPPAKRVTVPQSQLFHFYSPLTWARVVKLDYEIVSLAERMGRTNTSSFTDHLPIRNFDLVYSSDNAQLSTRLRNELTVKSISSRIDLREIQSPISLQIDGTLDLGDLENKLSLSAASDHPRRKEIYLSTAWQNRDEFRHGSIEFRTPFEDWEMQSMSGTYARNNHTLTIDWEFNSDALGKAGTTITFETHHFSMILNTPFEQLKDLDMRADTSLEEESSDTYNTVVSLKTGSQELFQLDLLTTFANHWPSQMKGTIATDLKFMSRGNVKAALDSNNDIFKADSSVDWENNQKFIISLLVKLPNQEFEELDMKVTTTFKNYEIWKFWAHRAEDEGGRASGMGDEVPVLDGEIWKPKLSLDFKIETPIRGFDLIEGKSSFQMGSSFFHVKKVTLSGNAPNGSLDIMSSWIISEWNRFDIHTDSKYSLHSIPTALQHVSIPTSNFLKFRLRNVIPSLDALSTLDSAVDFETRVPAARAGLATFVKLVNKSDVIVKLRAKFPETVHGVEFKSKVNEQLKSIDAGLVYSTEPASESCSSTLKARLKGTGSLEGTAEIECGKGDFFSLQSKFDSSFTDNNIELQVQVFQPQPGKPSPERVAVLDANFDKISGRHKARLVAETGQMIEEGGNTTATPAGPVIVDLDVIYLGIQDMTSSLNVTSPFSFVPSAGLNVVSKILRNKFQGQCGGHLGEGRLSATYDFEYVSTQDFLQLDGTLDTIFPFFEDFKSATVKGFYKSRPTVTEAKFSTDLDAIPYVATDYKHETSSSAGREKDSIQLDLQNPFWPLGITRSYTYDYSGGFDGFNLPTTTVRLVELYDLGANRDLHKLGGELKIHTNFNGREITLTGIHPSRRMKLSSSYEFLDHRFQQNSSFSWSSESFIGYDLEVRNLTTSAKSEHSVGLRVSYPVRVIALNMGLQSNPTGFTLLTDVNLNEKRSERKLSGIFKWDAADKSSPSNTVRKMSLVIKHPALPQEIKATGELAVAHWESASSNFSLVYAGDPRKRLTLMLKALPTFSGPYWNLRNDLRLEHSATNLDLTALSTNRHSAHELSIITLIDFKNSGKAGRKSKIAFELFKELRKLHIMLINPEEQFEITGALTGQYPLYEINAEENITGVFPHPKAHLRVDFTKPHIEMYAVHGSDLTDGIYAEGGLIDSRNVKFDITESYDNFRFTDVSYFLRINHSRLVTSKLHWRPEILQELQEFVSHKANVILENIATQSEKAFATATQEGMEAALNIWTDANLAVGPFLQEMSEACDFTKDSEAFNQFIIDSRENNDFYSQDISSLAQVFADEVSLRFSNIFIKIREYRRDLLGDSSTSELFEQTLLWSLEKMKLYYRQFDAVWRKYHVHVEWPTGPGISFDDIRVKIEEIVQPVLDGVLNLGNTFLEYLSNLAVSIESAVVSELVVYKPAFFNFVHQLEIFFYDLLMTFADFMYQTRENVMKSDYFLSLSRLAEDVDALYQDLSKNNASVNYDKYSKYFKNFISKKIENIDEYQKQFGQVLNYVAEKWAKFNELKYVKALKASMQDCRKNINWLVEYFRLDKLVQEAAITLYNRGGDLLYQTVLEAGARYQHAKTKFTFDAEKGIMDWEQKLPMPWSEFRQSPDFSQLPEYKNVVKAQELLDSTHGSILEAYYKSKQDNRLINWLPPEDSFSMLVGSEYFFTVDGRFYNFTGPCVYLLAGDLVDSTFSVSIQYKEKRDGSLGHQILVSASHNTLIIDLEDRTIRDAKRPQNVGLPMQLQNLDGYKDRANLVVETKNKGVTVSCNTVYWLCQLRVSGWYSRKVAGLLGTMDQEPTTDLIFSNRKVASDVNDMAKSWDVSDEGTESCLTNQQHRGRNSRGDSTTISTCTKLFHSRLSSLQPCFSTVKVHPFREICEAGAADSSKGACTASAAYVAMCESQGIVIEMPAICIKCDLNGGEMIDRDVGVMDTSARSILSVDIVLLVEAKDCNKNIWTRKNMDTLVKALETQLADANFEKNRYSVVIFGGTGVSAQPLAISRNNTIFAGALEIGQYLTHIPTGEGNNDIFGAIAYSLKLNFRPRVSKVFILFPCSTCQPGDMSMDFSTIHYAMLEQDATLHILMNNDLPSDNKKVAKKFFGMDNEVAYTKGDAQKGTLQGNANLRRQLKIPRSTLGYCTPLALQSNGTVFNGRKLQNKRKNIVELFSTLFSKRVVKNFLTPKCKICYCVPGDDGLGRTECYLCDYPRVKSEVEADNSEMETNEEDLIFMTSTSTTTIKTTSAANVMSHHENPFDSKHDNEEDEDDTEDDSDEDSDEDDED